MPRFTSAILVAAGVFLSAAPSSAQVYISGGITIGVPVVAPPPVVVYRPAPPPVVVVAQPVPAPVYIRPAPVLVAPAPVLVEPEVPFESEIGLGIRTNGGITGAESASFLGGGGGFVRFHTMPNLQFELALDGFAGEGYAGAMREEATVTAASLFFFGPHENRFRFYLSAGAGFAAAFVGEGDRTDEPMYVGAFGGMGLEWRILDWLALNGELRGFVRYRFNERPEDMAAYVQDPLWNDGSCKADGECTDYEGGGTFHLGAIFYF